MSFLARSGDWVRGLAGWRRFALAFAAGALSALGFAPLGFFPRCCWALPLLLLLLDGADESRQVRCARGFRSAAGPLPSANI